MKMISTEDGYIYIYLFLGKGGLLEPHFPPLAINPSFIIKLVKGKGEERYFVGW